MIEVKNLKKKYIPKVGSAVNALNGVNLQIEETGLVFILGKSGSGKSTLLNLLGGLDKYDSGDILIKGKSTEEFNQSDFDSYRNTLVGFIFQEYNLLDDFSVGANIALALELQGEKATEEEVNQILRKVDLDGYGNRKTNELSGGQKQRVAIARALVKNPEIILADEPTGALDSNTGIQIFNILKELSNEKLVIVVSHDREFAEKYGDRVIELSDGLIISDIKKVATKINHDDIKELKYIENEGFIIDDEYKLTIEDLDKINEYLKKNQKIEIKTKKSRKDSHLMVFEESKNNIKIKKYDYNFEMIKSKLPFMMAFKMGASGLKYKKIRLVFTILLSMVSFVLFGITDTLASYNEVNAHTNSIKNNKINDLIYVKEERKEVIYDDYKYTNVEHKGLDAKDLSTLEKITGLEIKPVYSIKENDYDIPYSFDKYLEESLDNSGNNYYFRSIAGFIYLDMKDIDELGFKLYGNLPINDNEIVIPKYMFQHFQEYGYVDETNKLKISADKFKNFEDIIGFPIKFENPIDKKDFSYNITGVIDTNFKTNEFDVLKGTLRPNYTLLENFRQKLIRSYNNLAIITNNHMSSLVFESENKITVKGSRFSISFNNYQFFYENVEKINKNSNFLFFDKNKSKLNNNEIIVDYYTYMYLDRSNKSREISNFPNYSNSYNRYIELVDENYNKKLYDYATDNYLRLHQEGFFEDSINPEIDRDKKISKIIETLKYYYYYLPGTWFDKSGIALKREAINETPMNLEEEIVTISGSYNEINTEVINEMALVYAINNYQEAYENGFFDNYNDASIRFDQLDLIEMYKHHIKQYNPFDKTYTSDTWGDIFNDSVKKYLINNIEDFDVISGTQSFDNYNEEDKELTNKLNLDVKIVGINFYDFNTKNLRSDPKITVSDFNHKIINDLTNANPYGFFIAKMPKSQSEIKNLIKSNYKPFEDNFYYRIKNEITPAIDLTKMFVEDTTKIFLYIAIGFALFSGFMLSNFIATSVAHKKREIGILRALGARSNDVFEIFLYESLIIALINFLFSLITTIITVELINNYLRQGIGLKLTIFNFGVRQIILLLLISVVVAVIASFLPVYKFAKKKPVDAISNK